MVLRREPQQQFVRGQAGELQAVCLLVKGQMFHLGWFFRHSLSAGENPRASMHTSRDHVRDPRDRCRMMPCHIYDIEVDK